MLNLSKPSVCLRSRSWPLSFDRLSDRKKSASRNSDADFIMSILQHYVSDCCLSSLLGQLLGGQDVGYFCFALLHDEEHGVHIL